jgi:hypothetical protein
MKAYFIYRDGEKFGNLTGYTTEKGARKALVGCEDWYKVMRPYKPVFTDADIPQREWIDMGIYVWSDYKKCYLFKREVWSRKVWNKYVKEHYQFIEQDYEIDIK